MTTLPEKFKILDDFPEISFDDWKKTVEREMEGIPFEQRLKTKTYSGIYLQFIYTKKDIENLPYINNKPGFKNFIRGTKAEGYLENPWIIAQEIPYPIAEEFNEALRYDLERGQDSINIILDKSTRSLDKNFTITKLGIDGLVIQNLSDLEKALANIDLLKYPIFVKTGYSNLPFLMLFNSYLEKMGYETKKIKGSIESDPLDFAASEGCLPVNMKLIYDEIFIATKWAIKNMPYVKTIGVSTLQYHNAGSNIVQEIAVALSTAVEYIKQMLHRGLEINEIARNIRFTFGINSLYFLEIAKLRAVKMLWAKIIEAFGGNEESQKIDIHARTSFNNQTKYDPYVNMLRTTTEAFSAVVGGVNSLHTNCFDETLRLPDEFARRIARNTQIILKEEAHLNQLIDPAGGSYFVENLTYEMAKKSWSVFHDLESKGGILKALESGFIQEEIDKIANEKKNNYAKRKTTQVGINAFANVKEEKLQYEKTDSYNILKNRFEEYEKNKNTKLVNELINEINLFEDETLIFQNASRALTVGATTFDIANALRKNQESDFKINPIVIHRTAEIFEELRDASLDYKKKNGYLPKVFLLPMGALKQNKARADFSKAFFEIGGFDVISQQRFHTVESAIDSAIKSDSKIAVICSTDETYPELVPQLTYGIKAERKDMIIVLAGYPKDYVDKFKKYGVDEFIYLGCDAHQILKSLMIKIGVIK